MDVNFINSLILCTKAILEEVVRVESEDIQVSIQQGANSFEGNGVVLKVEGDIEGNIIFDLSKQLFSQIALAVAGETDLWSLAESREEYNELLKSVVLEFGNLINGRIISTMHMHNYKCKSYPEKAFYENLEVLAPRTVTTIIIEAKTKYGNYNIYITNKNERFRENISIILYDIIPYISMPIVNYYTPKGFFFVKTDDPEHAVRVLQNKNIDFMLINIDSLKNPVQTIIEIVKYRPEIKVIVFSTEEMFASFHGIKDANIVGYISNILPQDAITRNLEHFFELQGIRKSERRQHVRVKVSLMDNARVSFVYHNKTISGDLLDVGIGGLMFALDNNLAVDKFEYGENIQNIKMVIGKRKIAVNGTVRSFNGKNVNIEITSLDDINRDLLSQYLSESLSTQMSDV